MQPKQENNLDYTVSDVSLFNIRNRNETRVIQAMMEILPEYEEFDHCQLCVEDVFALTLNALPTEYAQIGSIVFRWKASLEIVKEAVHASVKKVIENPSHKKG